MIKQAIYNFLEKPDTFLSKSFSYFIVILILLSSFLALLQLFHVGFLEHYNFILEKFEHFVLGIFTLEFLLRMLVAPGARSFLNRPANWVDFISIIPFYFGITNAVLIRLFRVFRVMKLSRKSFANFLDNPRTKLGITIRFFIIILIIVSSSLALFQLIYPQYLSEYSDYIQQFEYIALAIFSIEFFARLFASNLFFDFVKKPANWIDFLAIAPFYFGINDAVLLRIFRILRLFKIANSLNILKSSSVFDFRHSILRIVSPIIIIFIFIKGFIWIMESKGLWFDERDLKTLFTIIGFSLGVILSQKIGRSYGKYIKIQDLFYSLHGKLHSLQQNINIMSEKKGDILIYEWLHGYMDIYHMNKDQGSLEHVRKLNAQLYSNTSKIGNTEHIPFHRLAAMMSSMFELAIFIQSKRINRTPITYNLLLQQVILVYLLLLAIFIPGFVGMISVIFGGYLLYGMYQLTNDFDDVRSPSTNKFRDLDAGNLITLDALKIENYLQELKNINT